MNGCIDGVYNCSSDGTCYNTPGGFNCVCNKGYNGDGVICTGKSLQYLFACNKIMYYNYQILMSVPMLPLTTVILMLTVPTLLGVSPVHVTKDILEMEPLAMVRQGHMHAFLFASTIAFYHDSGPPSSPIFLSTSSQSISITLTWSQSPGDVVDSYQISYSFTIRRCGIQVNDIALTTGSSREYTLTELEENSDFTISITAMNGVGSSPPANTTARTAIAGRIHPS